MHIYAIIYAYNLIYCLNIFFYYNVQLKLSAFSHCPPIFEGVDRGVGFSPLPPPYLPLPSPSHPLSAPPFSERCALRARKIPSLFFFLPSRPLFSLLPPPLLPPPAPSHPLPPIISHLPLTQPDKCTIAKCITVQRLVTFILLFYTSVCKSLLR